MTGATQSGDDQQSEIEWEVLEVEVDGNDDLDSVASAVSDLLELAQISQRAAARQGELWSMPKVDSVSFGSIIIAIAYVLARIGTRIFKDVLGIIQEIQKIRENHINMELKKVELLEKLLSLQISDEDADRVFVIAERFGIKSLTKSSLRRGRHRAIPAGPTGDDGF